MKSEPQSSHPPESAFQEYLDGEMTPEEAHQFETHLNMCKACTVELAFWQETFTKIESLPDMSLSRNLAEEIVPKLDKGQETSGVLNLILAEAALGVTLAVVLMPILQTWFVSAALNYGSRWQIGLVQIHLFLSSLFEPLNLAGLDLSGLGIESLLGETFWLPTIIAALVLLLLGNGIVLKTTQTDHQRRR